MLIKGIPESLESWKTREEIMSKSIDSTSLGHQHLNFIKKILKISTIVRKEQYIKNNKD